MSKYFLVFAFMLIGSALKAQDVVWEEFCGVVVTTQSEGEGGVINEKSLKQESARTGAINYYTPVVDNSNREDAEITALRAFQNDALDSLESGKKYCLTGVRGAEGTVGSDLREFVLNFHSVKRK